MQIMLIISSLISLMLVGCKYEPPYSPVEGGGGTPNVTEYQAIALTSNATGDFTLTDDKLKIKLSSSNSTYGVCLPNLAKGHFIAEATADKTENFGLAIVREKNGKPDYDNFTSVSVVVESGVPVVRVIDRQNGVENVLDNTGAIADKSKRYAIKFVGTDYSVPFTGSTGKVRILRNDISGFFHFYVSVGKHLNGKFNENWIELAQSKDWNTKGQNFFICPITRTGASGSAEVTYSNIRFEEFASQDISDEATGFKVIERDYTWAGFPGTGIVVTFDNKLCPAATGDRKFVFWSEANNVPLWHMNNELLFCYEFGETWAVPFDNTCYEPMSDRLQAYAKSRIVEDNKVRKTVAFKYALINPDYLGPYNGGTDFPEVEDYYTFYPDGVGVRKMVYTQKETTSTYNYHELAEPMIVSGSSTECKEHVKAPAMNITNLAGNSYSLFPEKPFDEVLANVKNWKEQIYTFRLKNSPDIFCVYSYTPERPEVAPLPIENDLSWHDIIYWMSHWPVDKQPYGDWAKSGGNWKSQVAHTSFIGVEAKGDVTWQTKFKVDSDGNKYREYLMLFGITQPDAKSDVDDYTRAWLYHGTFSNLNGVKYNAEVTGYTKREIVLQKEGTASISFTYNPEKNIKNPVFRIDNWSETLPKSIKYDGALLVEGTDYVCDKSEGSLVIWLNKVTSQSFTLAIE